MKKDLQEKNKKPTNVEFGTEFGDINASKHYEIPFMNQKNKRKKNK